MSFQFFDYFGRCAAGYAIRRNIFCHYGISTDNASFSNGDAGHHRNFFAEPDIAADMDRSLGV